MCFNLKYFSKWMFAKEKPLNMNTTEVATALFKTATRSAKMLMEPLRLPPAMYEPPISHTSTSNPSPSSSDKTDNPNTFGFNSDCMPDMRLLEERIKTFQKWPVTFLSPEQLAQNGFYYLGRGDEVRCAFCKVEIMRWVEGDDPAKDHQRYAPQCPFMRKAAASGNGTDTETPGGRDECGAKAPTPRMPGPVHPQYATEASRLASFKDWPRGLRQKPQDLAEAGFFYTGKGDKTMCFYCDGGLKDWEADDIPWEQHARWFDRCAYVQLVKGREYVQRVISEASAVPKPPSPPLEPEVEAEQPKQSETLSVDESKICKICYAEERNVCFVPCGHVVACVKCAMSTGKCPMCRRTFTDAVRLYFS